jgi:hypothetical protein
MDRRTFLVMVGAVAIGTPALADHEDDIIERLTEEGYERIDVTRTLLGRVRIVAFKGRLQRELVLNPRTGEILRDIVTSRGDDSSTVAQGSKSGSSGTSGSSGSSGGSGSSGSNSGSSGSSGSDDSGSDHDSGDDDHSGKDGGDDNGDD